MIPANEKRMARRKKEPEPVIVYDVLPGAQTITVDLPMPQSANTIWRRGRLSTYINPSYVKWKAKADAELARQLSGDWETIRGPFNVTLTLPFRKRFIIDLDNRIKASLDWAAQAGLIENDKFQNRVVLEWGDVPLGARLSLTQASPLDLACLIACSNANCLQMERQWLNAGIQRRRS